MGVVNRTIQVGDDLGGKTLHIDVTSFRSVFDDEDVIVVSNSNNKIYIRHGFFWDQLTVKVNTEETELVRYSHSSSNITTYYSEFTLPSGFGTVTSIGTNSSAQLLYSQITVDIPVYLNVNQTNIENVYVNGTKMNEVYLNGNKVF